MSRSRNLLIRTERWLAASTDHRSVRGWLHDRYCALVVVQVDGWSKAGACLLRGHRDVREVPHMEICEELHHDEDLSGLIERWCRHCEAGYLTPRHS